MNTHLFHLLFTVLATAPGAPHCHIITCEKKKYGEDVAQCLF